jgi:hypothetical protein
LLEELGSFEAVGQHAACPAAPRSGLIDVLVDLVVSRCEVNVAGERAGLDEVNEGSRERDMVGVETKSVVAD